MKVPNCSSSHILKNCVVQVLLKIDVDNECSKPTFIIFKLCLGKNNCLCRKVYFEFKISKLNNETLLYETFLFEG